MARSFSAFWVAAVLGTMAAQARAQTISIQTSLSPNGEAVADTQVSAATVPVAVETTTTQAVESTSLPEADGRSASPEVGGSISDPAPGGGVPSGGSMGESPAPEDSAPTASSGMTVSSETAGDESTEESGACTQGDFNCDDTVDLRDFFVFADAFGQTVPPADPRFDLDGDGEIGLLDFFAFAKLFRRPGKSTAKLFALAREMLGLPAAYALSPNYPNPFNAQTAIEYSLPQAAQLRIAVFDLAGQRVRTLVEGQQEAGRFRVVWDGRDEAGRVVANGAYFYQLETGSLRLVRKLMLLK